MSQFIESICIQHGVVRNLSNHQLRLEKTLEAFSASENKIVLSTFLETLSVPVHGLFKLRIVYDLRGNYQAEWAPYQYKTISNFALVDIKGRRYNYKFTNRDWILEALKQSGKDEIIMHDGGMIKDSSYANLVFNDGVNWYTPEAPLLEGTQRAKLIQEGVIQTKALYLEDLQHCTKFRCINAMIDWHSAVDYKPSMIVL